MNGLAAYSYLHARISSRLLGAALLLIGLFLGTADPALAQSNPLANPLVKAVAPAAKPTTAEDIDSLIKTLDDDQARAKLKQQLQLLLQAQRGQHPGAAATPGQNAGIGAKLLGSISHHIESVSNALVNLVQVVADFPNRIRGALQALSDPALRDYWLNVVIDLFGVLAAAFAAAILTNRVIMRPRRVLQQQETRRWIVRILYVPLIFVFESLPTIAFALVSYIALPLFDPSADARLITTAILGAQIASQLAGAAATALLTPAAPSLRVLRCSDETAAYLRLWVRRLAVVGFYGYALTQLVAVIGFEPTLEEALHHAWGLLLAAMGVILVFQNRVAVAERIAGGPLTAAPETPPDEAVATPLEPQPEADQRTVRFKRLRRQVAKLWHVLAVIYIIAVYAVSTVGIEGGFSFLVKATVFTVILLLLLRLADDFVREVFDRSFALPDEVKRVLPGLESRANRYLPILKQAVLIGVYLVGLFALLQIWGVDVIGWVSDGAGRPIMAGAFKIVIIIAVSALLSEVVNLAIEHYLREQDMSGRRIYHSGRVRTLLPMLRNAFRITLTVIVLLVVLSQIGVDIAPLLAAAGVVGLAVGFGAQTLVKDIITGVFILLEDTIAIGDVVDLGGSHAGVVEGMTIRTMRLRDGSGSVHTVPFSSVTIVQNLTKDFSYATFDLKVDYREDVDKVLEAIKEVGGEIAKDPQFRYGIIGPLEIIGVDAFQDSGVLVKARMKTRAMSQWDVMRAFNLRLKRLFDHRGLRFPGVMAANPAPAAAPAPAPQPDPTTNETPPQPAATSESKTIAVPR